MALKNLYYLNKTNHHDITEVWLKLVFNTNAGADPGFQVKGVHLKKMRRAEGGAKYFGVFRVKNHDFTPKNLIFSNFRGERTGCAPPPPGSAPAMLYYNPTCTQLNVLSELYFTDYTHI